MARRRPKTARASVLKRTKASRPKDAADVPATGRTLSVGVGLKESEVTMLDAVAQELDVTRNAVMRYALRYFLKAYRTGKADPAADVEMPPVKKRLHMP